MLVRRRLRPSFLALVATSGLLALGSACSAGTDKDSGTTFGRDTGPGSEPTGDSGGFEPTPTDDGGLNVEVGEDDSGPVINCVGADPDCDGDGYPASKDCDDLEKSINPEAYDFPDDGIDNDCDGTKDNPVTTCDATPAEVTSKLAFARSIELCPQRAVTKTGKVYDPAVKVEWGKISGKLIDLPLINPTTSETAADGTQILGGFGNNAPRGGSNFFGMQSGKLLETDPRGSEGGSLVPNACKAVGLKDADCKSLSSGTLTPAGDAGGPFDIFGLGAANFQEVKITIKAPSNAKAMSFDFAFFSSEFNEFVNTNFNDAFFALAKTKKIDGMNVAKDEKGNAITVNSGFFQLCPRAPGPSSLAAAKRDALRNCVGMDGDTGKSIFGTLRGTHFDGASAGATDGIEKTGKYVYGGGSGWLRSKFEVTPGEEFTIRFIIFDTSDSKLSSAVVVDNVLWEKSPPDPTKPPVDRPPS
jgi:hypothetical protein